MAEIKKYFEIARSLQVTLRLIDSGGKVPLCGPPPPNGYPDDRGDAFQNESSPLPTGVSRQIAAVQQKIAAASKLGLSRASAYWTLELRKQELSQFTADTTRALSYTHELDTIVADGERQMQGLGDGTIPLSAGQTLTDALQLVYDDAFDGALHTDYDLERETLTNSLEFAQRNYKSLRGQELELQHELRVMEQTDGVGVLDNGLVTWALAAIGSVGIDAKPIQILPGMTSSNLPDSHYYSPYEAPKVVVVPSGGLYSLGES